MREIDDRAVSPVMAGAFILVMVVALAAGSGVLYLQYVEDAKDAAEPAPQFVGEAAATENGSVMIVHQGGDTVDTSEVKLKVFVEGKESEAVYIRDFPVNQPRVTEENVRETGDLEVATEPYAVTHGATKPEMRTQDALGVKLNQPVDKTVHIHVIHEESNKVIAKLEAEPKESSRAIDSHFPDSDFTLTTYDPGTESVRVEGEKTTSADRPGDDWERHEQVDTNTDHEWSTEESPSDCLSFDCEKWNHDGVVDTRETQVDTKTEVVDTKTRWSSSKYDWGLISDGYERTGETDVDYDVRGHDHDRTWYWKESSTSTARVYHGSHTITEWHGYHTKETYHGYHIRTNRYLTYDQKTVTRTDTHWHGPYSIACYGPRNHCGTHTTTETYTITEREWVTKTYYIYHGTHTEKIWHGSHTKEVWHGYHTKTITSTVTKSETAETCPVSSCYKSTGHEHDYYTVRTVDYEYEKDVTETTAVYGTEYKHQFTQPVYEWEKIEHQTVHKTLDRGGEADWTVASDIYYTSSSELTVDRLELTDNRAEALTLVADGEDGKWSTQVYRDGDYVVVEASDGTTERIKAEQVTIDFDDNTVSGGGETVKFSTGLANDLSKDIGQYDLRVKNGDSARGELTLRHDGDEA